MMFPMKKNLLFVLFCFTSYYLFSQTGFNKPHWLKELKIGDKMPDMPLGTIVNNKAGNKKFSDLKGKIVILDFWFTGCTSCIESFPKMEKLQKHFGDKIQIFIVNPWENQQQIEKKFNKPGYKGPQLPDLPSIVDAKDMAILFPLNSVPHHVWIDTKGVIRIRGSQLSTYEEKINDLLANKEIVSINDDNSSLPFENNTPYYQIINRINTPFQTASYITVFNNNYSASNGGITENFVDSSNKTIRNTFINQEILELYRNAYANTLQKNILKTIYSNYKKNSAPWLDYFILSVKDTLQYTSRFEFMHGKKTLTDKQYIKSRFCYEQILPAQLSEKERTAYMLTDLDRYFSNLYGLEVKPEIRRQTCYVLKRTSAIDKLKTADPYATSVTDTVKINGKQLIRYNNTTLRDLVWELLAEKNTPGFFPGNNNSPLFVFDETGIENAIAIALPGASRLNSLEDLRNALKAYDLDIIPAEREIEFVVFHEKK